MSLLDHFIYSNCFFLFDWITSGCLLLILFGGNLLNLTHDAWLFLTDLPWLQIFIGIFDEPTCNQYSANY